MKSEQFLEWAKFGLFLVDFKQSRYLEIGLLFALSLKELIRHGERSKDDVFDYVNSIKDLTVAIGSLEGDYTLRKGLLIKYFNTFDVESLSSSNLQEELCEFLANFETVSVMQETLIESTIPDPVIPIDKADLSLIRGRCTTSGERESGSFGGDSFSFVNGGRMAGGECKVRARRSPDSERIDATFNCSYSLPRSDEAKIDDCFNSIDPLGSGARTDTLSDFVSSFDQTLIYKIFSECSLLSMDYNDFHQGSNAIDIFDDMNDG